MTRMSTSIDDFATRDARMEAVDDTPSPLAAAGAATPAQSKSLPLAQNIRTVGSLTTEDPLFSCLDVDVF